MPRLHVGEKMPDFTFETPYEKGLTIGETAKKVAGKTAVVFMRYYGCTMCQYDIHLFKTQHEKIAATGGQMLVVLQSDPVKLAAQVKPGDLPFDIICDPDQKLYQQFDIRPAASPEAASDEPTIAQRAPRAAYEGKFLHGEYEGNELQLPATFVVEPDLTITFAEYHKGNGGVPSPDELAELLK